MPSPSIHCLPVPTRVLTWPLSRLIPRRAWFTVSATTTSYPSLLATSAGSTVRPFGSEKAAWSAAVGESTAAGAEASYHGGRVLGELDDAVVPRVGDQEPVVQGNHLRREAEVGRLGLGSDVRRLAARQRAGLLVLGDQLRQLSIQRVRVPFTRVLRDDVAVRIHQHERRPGPGGVVLPGHQLGVVQHRMPHLVPLHRGPDRRLFPLMRELRRMHPDDHQRIAVLLLQRPQLIQHMQAVDTAERPEIQQQKPPPEVRERQLPPTRVQPPTTPELRRTHIHTPILRRPSTQTHHAIMPTPRPPPTACVDGQRGRMRVSVRSLAVLRRVAGEEERSAARA